MVLRNAIALASALLLSWVLANPGAGEDEKGKSDAERLQAALNTPTPVGAFTETTTVEGKITADLRGVWLVVANTQPNAQVDPERFQPFVQIFKVTGDGAKPEMHIMDVKLPAAITVEVARARSSLRAWEPTAEQLTLLRESWSELKPYTEKTLNEHILASLEYTLVAPDHYMKSSLTEGEAPPEVLEGSAFGLRVVERYRPGRVPEETPVTIVQVMGRTSVYGLEVNEQAPDRLQGRALVGFVAAGAGMPLPFSFPGRVVMYRLAPLSATRVHHSSQHHTPETPTRVSVAKNPQGLR